MADQLDVARSGLWCFLVKENFNVSDFSVPGNLHAEKSSVCMMQLRADKRIEGWGGWIPVDG